MHVLFRFTLITCLLVLGAASARGQLPLRWENTSSLTGIQRATKIVPLADTNQDGVADLVIASAIPADGSGIVELLSGADGQVLAVITTPDDHDGFGADLAVLGDVDADGTPDLAVGAPHAPNGGAVYVYSGATGTLIYIAANPDETPNFGASLDTTSDFTGDGIIELVVGNPSNENDGGSLVHLFSGGTGARLSTWVAPDVQRTGSQLATLDDITQDGVRELAIASEGHSADGPAAFAYVIDGLSGAILYLIPVTAPNVSFKGRVSAIGDLDDDGIDDFVVGMETSLSVFSINARIAVHSGATGAVIAEHPLTNSPLNCVASGDLNGDGRDEYLASTAAGIFIFGGASLREKAAFRDTWLGANATNAVAVLGDISGDGLGEFVFGEGSVISTQTMIGVRKAYSGGGSNPPLELDWGFDNLEMSLLGTVTAKNGTPFDPGLLIVSFAPGSSTFFGAPIYIDPTPDLILDLSFNATGLANFRFSLSQPSIEGLTAYLQAIQGTAAGVTSSNLLELLYGPGRIEIEGLSQQHVQGGDTVTLRGFGFDRVERVTVDGRLVSPTSQLAHEITIQIPNETRCATPVTIRLENSFTESAVVELNPAVSIDQVINATGPAESGSSMILLGGPFDSTVEVTVGGVPVVSNALSETTLHVIVPHGPPGTAVVEVAFGSGCRLFTSYLYF